MKCPRCQQENSSRAKFCLECGTPLKTTDAGGSVAPSYAELTSALTEAFEQQTATSEILRVISSSALTDLQSVLDAIAANAGRLCESHDVVILRVEGALLRIVAGVGDFYATADATTPITRGSVAGRALVDRTLVHIHDVDGYQSYCGRYEVDEAGSLVLHRVAMSSNPNWTDSLQKRFVEFIGDRMKLTTPPLLRQGKAGTAVLIWERAN